jgi:hypothetical protein
MNAPINNENERPESEGDRPESPEEGTSPPGNPPVDEEAVERGTEQIEQAGGGH